MRIAAAIEALLQYGIQTGLIDREDRIWAQNRILEILQLDAMPEFSEKEEMEGNSAQTAGEADGACLAGAEGKEVSGGAAGTGRPELAQILDVLIDDAAARGILDGESVVARDLFDTKLMGALTPPPSIIREAFRQQYAQSPEAATDWFYRFSQDTNYIRRDRIQKDVKWKTSTEYGDLDITINLSKPEKDPKAIAAAKLRPQSGYPKCQLCAENEGYAGRLDHPARQNHRIIPVTINDSPWFLQYSPYVYYNEHCIVFNSQHTPMKIDRAAFRKLLDFVKLFPHYFVGSNADLPIVGGSILSHDHFQGGHYTFAMAKAPMEEKLVFAGFEQVEAGIVKWPMSVIRLRCADDAALVDLAERILACWRGYTDESAFIFAETEGEPHNTITPIARFAEGKYELDLVLRCNITTEEHPLGVFHPHQELHHIKKENIGLIEVMGLAVLPARLKEELALLAGMIRKACGQKDALGEAASDAQADFEKAGAGESCLSAGVRSAGNVAGTQTEAAADLVAAVRACEQTEKHADWIEELAGRHDFAAEDSEEVLRDEVGAVFAKVLEHAGVYKRTPEGRAAFLRFVDTVNAKKA